MTQFPDSPLDVRAELLLAGAWTDVSAYLDHGPVSIGRGHPDESATVSPSTLALTWTNTDARFSSKNPVSPYYPYLVRNTPCRASIPSDQPYLRLESDRLSYASCPAVSVTTDLDVRADVQLTDWRASDVAGSWQVGGAFGWALTLDAGGYPRLFWSTTGSDFPSARATARMPAGRIVLRATLQLSTGNVTWYTAPGGGADAGPWTQLGAVVNVTGATSLHAPAVAVTAGNLTGGAGIYGRLYELEVRSGIGGTVVAHPVFSAQSAGTTSFSDGQGNTWTLSGTSELSARDYRLHAEVPEWPQHQDPTGKTWTVAAKGGGLLRRTSQRNNALNSAMWRAWVKAGVDVAGYWPLEDGVGAQSLASGIGGPAAVFSGALQLASNSDFTCSAPLPVLNGTVIVGRVPPYPGTWQGNQFSWLMEIPSGGEFNTAEVLRFSTNGTVAQVTVTYGTGGSLTPSFLSAAGTLLAGGGPVTFNANGQQFLMAVSLTPDGSGGVNWFFEAATPGAASFVGTSGNIPSASVGAVTSWTLNGGGQLLQTVVGHVAVQAAPSLWDVTAYGAALAAHAGEPAGVRFARLCVEEGIQFRAGGDLSVTTLMGVQAQQTLTQLLQECADADRGVWYELRQQLGWGYVPRSALYNQASAVAVTYSQDMLGEWASDPTEDDKDIRNDETVTQTTGGGSARQFAAPGQAISGGRLSVLSPSSGSGTYDGADSLNIWQATDLPSIAAWIAHVGTVDEPRYPGIVLDLSNRALASIFYQVLALDLGQRLTVSSPPAQLGPDTVSQLAWQLNEELWGDTLKVTMAGVPSRPYLVAQEGFSTGRLDTDGSALSGALSAPLNPNPFAAGGSLAGWSAAHGAITATSSPAAGVPLPYAVAFTADGTGQFCAAFGASFAATPNAAYQVSALGNAIGGYSGVNIGVNWFDGGGGYISTSSGTVAANAGAWTPYALAVTAPASAATGQPFLQLAASSGNVPAGQQLQVQALVAWSGAVSAASAGIPWTENGGDLPFDVAISGERVTVTAIGDGGSGSVTSPGTFAFLVQLPLPAGTWTIGWWVQLGGTLSGADASNFTLVTAWAGGGSTVATSNNGSAAGTYAEAPVVVTLPVAGTVSIKSGGTTPTAGSIYTGIFKSPQLMTVTRSVNGVAKAQASGAPVALWSTPVAAL